MIWIASVSVSFLARSDFQSRSQFFLQSSVDNIFAPERISIQCYLWRCEIPVHDYCSDSHRELAVNGEGIGNAITFIDGKKDPEIFEMSRKILLSKRRRKHCGVPHVAASDICSNPWEQGRVFWRELEPDETKRSWLFISEKDPEGFGIMWLPVHRPIDLPGGCVCQKYWLQPDYIQASGSFRLLRITDCFERFNKAVYWLNFMYHNKVADKGKAVTVGVSSEGKPAKRQHMDPTHIGLPKVLQMDPNYHPPRGSTSLKLNQVFFFFCLMVFVLVAFNYIIIIITLDECLVIGSNGAYDGIWQACSYP